MRSRALIREVGLYLVAMAAVALVLHIGWNREERLPGRGTISPAGLEAMEEGR